MSPLQPGDLIFFWGSGFLSWAIETVTGGPSHVAGVIPSDMVTDDGAGKGGPYLAESTIIANEDGVQITSFPVRIEGYDGSVALARLDSRIRGLLWWNCMWDILRQKVNRDTYNKLELVQYLVHDVAPWFPVQSSPNKEVCSELWGELYRAGGLPGIQPFVECPPQKLFQMHMWNSLEWIKGKPRSARGFNSQ